MEDSIYSEFFNDMFSFRMSNRRWFPMVVRAPGTKGQGIMGQTLVVKRSGTSNKEEAAAVRIQAHFRGYAVRKAYKTYKVGGKVNELLYSPAVVKGVGGKVVHPCPRSKASLVVLDNVLWLYGGSFEEKDREVTLDDLWTINLNKLDGWNCVSKGTFVLSLAESSIEDEDMEGSDVGSEMSEDSEDSEDDMEQ